MYNAIVTTLLATLYCLADANNASGELKILVMDALMRVVGFS